MATSAATSTTTPLAGIRFPRPRLRGPVVLSVAVAASFALAFGGAVAIAVTAPVTGEHAAHAEMRTAMPLGSGHGTAPMAGMADMGHGGSDAPR